MLHKRSMMRASLPLSRVTPTIVNAGESMPLFRLPSSALITSQPLRNTYVFPRHYAKDAKPAAAAAAAAAPEEPKPKKPLVKPDVPDFEEKPLPMPSELAKQLVDSVDPRGSLLVDDWKNFKFDPKITKIADEMLQLNQYDMMELMRYLQQRLGGPEAALFGGFGGGGGGGYAAAPVQAQAQAQAAPAESQETKPKVEEKKQEQLAFTLQLVKVDPEAKFKVLKEIRTMKPGMKILESKDMVEKLPSLLKENVPKEEAEQLVAKFKELGGEVQMK